MVRMDSGESVALYRTPQYSRHTDPLINHASKLRINLRSKELFPHSNSGKLQLRPPRQFSGRANRGQLTTQVYGRTGSAHRLACNPQPTYIHNVVIPLTTQSENSHTASNIYYSRYPSAVLLKSRRNSARTSLRPSVPPSTIDKYPTSSPRERSLITTSEPPRRNLSPQKLRFETEQNDRSESRMRKLSQKRPHQVDHMYYMSGTPLRLEARYRVEQEELLRLKELTRSRKKASYYGRGLRLEGEEVDELPHQPPPSSLGDAPEIRALSPDETNPEAETQNEVPDSISDDDAADPQEGNEELNADMSAVLSQMDNLDLQAHSEPNTESEGGPAQTERSQDYQPAQLTVHNTPDIEGGSQPLPESP